MSVRPSVWNNSAPTRRITLFFFIRAIYEIMWDWADTDDDTAQKRHTSCFSAVTVVTRTHLTVKCTLPALLNPTVNVILGCSRIER